MVNISGSLLLGLLAGLSLKGTAIPREWLMVGTTGFLGAYTTFSTWNLETLRLADQYLGLLNLFLNTVVGLAAAVAGIALGLAV